MESKKSGLISRKKLLAALGGMAAAGVSYQFLKSEDSGLGSIPSKRNIDPAIFRPKGPRSVRRVAGAADRTLLKDGYIVDGSGKTGFVGDLMIRGDKVELVTRDDIQFNGRTMNCSGLVVAPGFIDPHSHMDEIIAENGRENLKLPFTEQGITTIIVGNCGHGIAAIDPDGGHRDLLQKGLAGKSAEAWTSYDQYFNHLSRTALTHNVAAMAGHGTTRTSIHGFNAEPLTSDKKRRLIYLLEQAMDEGSLGVSFGLQYEPGVFTPLDELSLVARSVAAKDRIVSSHMKAYSTISGTYPLKPFGRPHNLLAIDDMLKIAKDTDVRMQLSHLIFVGSSTWDTCDEALSLVDQGIASGLDLMFDTYSYHCGFSVINVLYPEWFLARVPDVYRDSWALLRLRAELELIVALLGFGYENVQVLNTKHPALEQYNGMFLKDIADARGLSQFDNFLDVTEKSEGRAVVLNHRYSSQENIKKLMKHPAALYMTDALVYDEGAQNPASFGCYPRFLQFARDFDLMTLEACVSKMTGAVAERFQLPRRGFLKEGHFADITIFDWANISDRNTREVTNNRPAGIKTVFMNGRQILDNGQAQTGLAHGRVIRGNA